MKITSIVKIKALIISIIITNIFAITNKNTNSETLQKTGNKSFEKNEVIESVSYALAREFKTDDFYVQNSKDFKSVEYMNTLPAKKPISDGVVETIEEVQGSPNEYYDGTKGMKFNYTVCNNYTTQKEACLMTKGCGWCGSSSSCIAGNNLGPLSPCLRSSYIFTSPAQEWNPLDNNMIETKKQNVLGANLSTIITNHPIDN